ncbi:MAG: hypothetical protein ACFFGZ_02990 [Candidatus Thorarchaeota archaeon]
MKKLAVSMGVATLFLLALAQFAPAGAVTLMDVTGYSLEDEKFAVTVDMNQDFYGILTGGAPNAARIELSGDLLDASNAKIASTDTYPKDDQEFYMAYANMEGIQAAYSALMKFEHNVSAAEVLNTFWDDLNFPSAIDLVKSQIINHASNYWVGYINATAPFQTLVEHWRTAPHATTAVQHDMFVANSYAALVAYSSTAEDQTLDPSDKLYLGYTFAFNYFKDAVNSFIDDNTDYGPNFVPDYTAKPFFETLDNGYKFGIEYTNLFVVWQEINAQRFSDRGGIIYGHDIVAASLLDSLTFTYTFTTQSLGTSVVAPGIELIQADIQTEYDFGETNLLVVQESAAPAGTWTDTFSTSDDYVFDLPQAFLDVIDIIPGVEDFPENITVPLPDLTFYLNDDAKRRIGYSDGGFGMTMVTMTNAFAVGMTPAHPDAAGKINDTIDILADGEKAFVTTFTDKTDYTLSELPADMTGNGPHTAIIDYFPAGNSYIQNLGTFYFKLEMGLAKAFLYLLALEMGLDNAADQGRIVDVAHHAYVTLTEYPVWNGGDIDHDPTYTAISGQGEGGEGSETETGSSAGAFAPGFEFLTVFLAAIPLILYKKRK